MPTTWFMVNVYSLGFGFWWLWSVMKVLCSYRTDSNKSPDNRLKAPSLTESTPGMLLPFIALGFVCPEQHHWEGTLRSSHLYPPDSARSVSSIIDHALYPLVVISCNRKWNDVQMTYVHFIYNNLPNSPAQRWWLLFPVGRWGARGFLMC